MNISPVITLKSFCEMPRLFSHFVKCLSELVIVWNDWNFLAFYEMTGLPVTHIYKQNGKNSPYMDMPDSKMVVYGLQGYRRHGYIYININKTKKNSPYMDMPDSEMVVNDEKRPADLNTQERKLDTLRPTWFSC